MPAPPDMHTLSSSREQPPSVEGNIKATGGPLSHLLPKTAARPVQAPLSEEEARDLCGIVVVDEVENWPITMSGVKVMSVWDYLGHEWTGLSEGVRVYNLCQSLAYQSAGYYASLLARAYGHTVQPDAAAVQDFQGASLSVACSRELEREAIKCLGSATGESARNIALYFGRSVDPRLQSLADLLHRAFPIPLLRASFVPNDSGWRLATCQPMVLCEVPEHERELMFEAASLYFTRHPARVYRPRTPASRRTCYELAILVNDADDESPSNAVALASFQRAAAERDMIVRFLGQTDARQVMKHDALFIRETTAVNHHTYEIARMAEREGLVVIDDPESILRCSNKVFLSQLMLRHRIAQPDTVVIHEGNLGCVPHLVGFPCVIKRPDSQFSLGVVKAHDARELRRVSSEMFRESDLLIAQRYEYTPFDWRIGVLDGQPLFACRYYMVDNHWQVVKRDKSGSKTEGSHDTLAIEHAPPAVVRVAVAAAEAVGRGLYGVDLKQTGTTVKVIEVNDNPNIDAGIEDAVLGMDLYRRIIGHFINRLDSLNSKHGRRA